MKRIVPYLILLFAFTYSCTKPVKPGHTVVTFDRLATERKVFVSNDSTKPYMTINLDFTYPSASSNDSLLKPIQDVFVYAFAGEEYKGKTPQEAFAALEQSMVEDALHLASDLKEDLPIFSECFENIKTEVTDTTKHIITIKSTLSSYMGGAHGSYNELYYNVDTDTGKLLKEEDIFDIGDKDGLSDIITQTLFDTYGDSIQYVLFSTEKVDPNGNFYFEDNNLVYIYNEYEIAPYSEGIIKVTLSGEKIKGILKPKYFSKIGIDSNE